VLRFISAGIAFIVAGAAIAVTKEGVGENALVVGSAVAGFGLCLIISGILRHRQGPPN
jgi:hypothetical protein